MKTKLLTVITATFIAIIVLSGCAASTGAVGHSINTNVELSHANFKVLSSVTGEAKGMSLLGVGINQSNLIDQARRDMISKAGLIGGSKAITNVTTEIQVKWFFIWYQKTVYVSGEVIEFTK